MEPLASLVDHPDNRRQGIITLGPAPAIQLSPMKTFLFSGSLQLVYLNACYSLHQGRELMGVA